MMRCESPKLNESDIPLRGNQPNLSISYLYLHYCSKNFKSCPSSKYFFLFSTLILADLINIKDKCLSQYTHVNASIHIAHLVRGYLMLAREFFSNTAEFMLRHYLFIFFCILNRSARNPDEGNQLFFNHHFASQFCLQVI